MSVETMAAAEAPDQQDLDARMMHAVIALGRRNLGLTAPNPSVGALVVRDGVVVGRGVTALGGRPHAETLALADAGTLARGATIYVSLEPCSHFGKTPPCAQAIIDAGIARVVSALDDPDTRVSGRGHAMLCDAGLDVTTHVCTHEAFAANLGHILRVTQGRPSVTLKLAETADGYSAGARHDPRLHITGEAANNRTQVMRAQADAIMIGIGTALVDDPLLTVRMPGLNIQKPLRVVLDTQLQLPVRSRLGQTARERPSLVICGNNASREAEAALAATGIEVARVSTDGAGHADLALALQLLAQRGVTRVFSEGGPRIAGQLIRAGLADEVILFTASKPLGRAGIRSLDDEARAQLAQGERYGASEDTMVGADRMRVWNRVI